MIIPLPQLAPEHRIDPAIRMLNIRERYLGKRERDDQEELRKRIVVQTHTIDRRLIPLLMGVKMCEIRPPVLGILVELTRQLLDMRSKLGGREEMD